MTEAEVLTKTRDHLEGLFPKVCANCGCRFGTFKEYLQNTTIAGSAIPYDADEGDWNPLHPIGNAAYANCACGTTLVLTSDGMPLPTLWSLLNWGQVETQKRGMTPQELLNYLREKICKQVLAAP